MNNISIGDDMAATTRDAIASFKHPVTPFERFFYCYVVNLDNAMRSHPSDYGIGASDVIISNLGPNGPPHIKQYSPELAARTANSMREAFLKGSYNKDGRAVRMTCRELGIKHTYKAIAEFFGSRTFTCKCDGVSEPDVDFCERCEFREISPASAKKLGIT